MNKTNRIITATLNVLLLYLFPIITIIVSIINFNPSSPKDNFLNYHNCLITFCSNVTTVSLAILFLKSNADNKRFISRKIFYIVFSMALFFISYFALSEYTSKNLVILIVINIFIVLTAVFSTIDYLKIINLIETIDGKTSAAINEMHDKTEEGEWRV